MRLTFRKLFVLLVLFCSYTVSLVVAQLQTPNGVDFKVTSSFVAQNVTFPAGTYNVKPSQDDIETRLFPARMDTLPSFPANRRRSSIRLRKPN